MDNNWIRFGAGVVLFLLGIFLNTQFALKDSYNPQVQTIVSFVAIVSGLFLMFWTIRMYHRMKKGISS